MGFDISQLFGSSGDTAKSGMSDVLKSGANAALGYLEQQAINVISADKKQHEIQAQASGASLLQHPSNPNSFGSYFSNLMQGPALQTYGPYVLGGVAIVAIITIMMARR